MSLLVRSWNLFHGRTVPETRRTDLERMVRLVSDGGPDVVCLQEVPVWALRRLDDWSRMHAYGAVTMLPLGGPFAHRLTELDARFFRSALTGQANAILASPRLRVVGKPSRLGLNPPSFRRRLARDEQLSFRTRLAWRRNRRVGQLVRLEADGRTFLVVNVHLTSYADSRLADGELVRMTTYAEGLAGPGEPILLCGDLNLTTASSLALGELETWGFSTPIAGIDQILARGLTFVRGPEPWPDERRRLDDSRLLSDHRPVEATLRVDE
jgi:endonuclease/exonuclease/phosphatase family metal-dependent hydrolase